MLLRECFECKSNTFDINEFIVCRAVIDKNNKLNSYNIKNNGIEMIICSKCKTEYSVSDFKGITY